MEIRVEVLLILFFSGSKQSPTSKNERQASLLRTGPDYEASGSTRDIDELQAALQAAQLTVTGTGSKYSGTQRESQNSSLLKRLRRSILPRLQARVVSGLVVLGVSRLNFGFFFFAHFYLFLKELRISMRKDAFNLKHLSS